MINNIELMTRPEVEDKIKTSKIAILPIGSTEQHGYHLPLGTDSLLAKKMSDLIGERLDAIVFPVLSYGYSWVWRDIAGTASIEQPILQQTLKSLAHSIARSGFEMLLVVSGHEANSATLKYLVREMNDESSMKVLNIFYPGLAEVYEDIFESDTWYGMFHADEFETSMMLEHFPELVNMELAVAEYPEKPIQYGVDATSIGALSKSGVYGDSTLATSEKGKKATKLVVDNVEKIVVSVKGANK